MAKKIAKKIVVGLGNPGTEYENTRHNTGQIVLANVAKKLDDSKIKFVIPDTFMNQSGKAVAYYIKSQKDLAGLVVIYDDIDIPLGSFKISHNRGDGGHNGLASVIKSIKSKEFVRIRVGICPTTPTGKLRKPKGEKKVYDFLLGEFKKKELETIKKLSKKIAEAIEMYYDEGLGKAMSLYN